MEKETFQVYEWRIENFSCWNSAVHGNNIYSPQFRFRFIVRNIDYVQKLEMLPNDNGQISVFVYRGKAKPSSGGNMSFINSDGSLICTKRTQINNWTYFGLKFEEVAAKIKKKKDRLTVRLCFLSKEGRAGAVSTTLDLLNLSMRIDPKSIESMESDDTKTISIIRYSKKKFLDALLLKAERKGETIEFILELLKKTEKSDLLTKTESAISVESQWSLQSPGESFVRKEENKYLFLKCEPWKFSNSLMSELVQNGVTVLLSLKIVNGDIFYEKLNAPSEITSVPKTTVSFFEPFKDMDSLSSKNLVDSVAELAKDFMGLYQDQDFSDFQLKCHNVSFPVHRNVLSARSPVFKTMLSTDMKEAASEEVGIGDLDPSTLALFLTYLYSGALEEDLQCDRALKLYYAADKYQVSSLKKECAQFLCDKVSIGNVCDFLSFADKYSDDELTAVAYSFVVNNFNQVLQSEEWASFAESDPKLALKTVTQLAQKNYVGKMQ